MIRFEVIIDRDNLSKDAQKEIQTALESAVTETAAGLEVEPPLEFLPLREALNHPGADHLQNFPLPGHTAGIWSPPPDFEDRR
jgi:hypothetical protein